MVNTVIVNGGRGSRTLGLSLHQRIYMESGMVFTNKITYGCVVRLRFVASRMGKSRRVVGV